MFVDSLDLGDILFLQLLEQTDYRVRVVVGLAKVLVTNLMGGCLENNLTAASRRGGSFRSVALGNKVCTHDRNA